MSQPLSRQGQESQSQQTFTRTNDDTPHPPIYAALGLIDFRYTIPNWDFLKVVDILYENDRYYAIFWVKSGNVYQLTLYQQTRKREYFPNLDRLNNTYVSYIELSITWINQVRLKS